MFYKIKTLLFVILSCVLAFSFHNAKAQGVVSLSEEAMFDDGLETPDEVPVAKPQAAPQAKQPVEDLTFTDDTENLPQLSSQPQASVPADIPSVTPSTDAAPTAEDLDNLDFLGEANPSAISDTDLFSKMSDLEKRTALLNLELRREKLQNEIEAVKNQRRQAQLEEQEKAEALRLKKIEAEKEQERKLLQEQEKLRELDIKFETLRQEKVLAAYKNQMLEETQKWIEHDANFYKQIADLRDSKKTLVAETQEKFNTLLTEARQAKAAHQSRIEAYKSEIKEQQLQMGVLRSRIEALEKEREEAKKNQNPFAEGGEAAATAENGKAEGNKTISQEPEETILSLLYGVTEIRGKGPELVAKLLNKNGTAFYVKKGTSLQSGHVIKDITPTYVMAEKDGEKSYLYFAAGGILPAETAKFEVEKAN